MAKIIKGGAIDDGQYPLPPDPRGTVQPGTGETAEIPAPFSGVDPAELQHTASELREIVGMVHGMRPTIQELSEALRVGAREQGYREGLARAQGEVAQKLVETLAALTDAGEERYRIARQNEGALADLALKIARKVIGAHLDADPSLVARIVQSTIADLEPSTSLVVHVNPNDLHAVEDSRREIERMVQGGGRIDIVGDDTVDPGGVVLVSPVGEVDARIETKLAILETAFAAQRRQLIDQAQH